MKIEDIVDFISNNEQLTEEQINEFYDLFYADANGDCKNVVLYFSFLSHIMAHGYSMVNAKTHKCSYAYILNIENHHHEYDIYLVYLYNNEASYFILLNSVNETLYYANKMLDTDNCKILLHCQALICIFNILASAKLFTKLLDYVDDVKKLLSDPEIDPFSVLLLKLSLLDIYCFNDKYAEYMEALEDFKNLGIDETNQFYYPFKVRSVLPHLVFKEELKDRTKEEYLANFNEIIHLFELSVKANVYDLLEPLLIPMFDIVKELMSPNDFINKVLEIIDMSQTKTDKIAFYNYLIDNFGDKLENKDELYKNYYNVLNDYIKSRNDAERQSIEITLMEHKLKLQYQEEALYDKLTGLQSINGYMNFIQKYNITDDCIVLVGDLNRLKYINDTYGHDSGDKALILAANNLKKAFSKYGQIFRYGGDEFYIIVRCTEDEVIAAINEMNELNNNSIIDDFTIGVSIGYCKSVDHLNENIQYMIKVADRNMYQNKMAYYKSINYKR